MIIQEESIRSDLGEIKISFSLLKGKTWSNVIPIFSGDSYFKQEIGGVSAAVRGTIFEVNAENGYIFAHKHEVTLTTDEEEVTLTNKNAYSLNTHLLVENLEDIKTMIDTTFIALNKKLDREYFSKLKKDFIEFVSSSPFNFVESLRTD